jgi:hypothetical protein
MSHVFASRRGLAHQQPLEDRAKVDHRLPQVLRALVPVPVHNECVRMAIALGDLRVIGGDVRGLLLGIPFGRISPLFENADDSAWRHSSR